MGCFHIRHDFDGPAPALEDLCAELERRTGLALLIKIEQCEVEPTKAASDGPSIPSPWPIYTEIAYVRVRGSTADVELHRAENTIGVEFLFGGVWLRRYLETVTLDVVRRAGGRTRDGEHEELPPWVTLKWREVPKVGLWFQVTVTSLIAGAFCTLDEGDGMAEGARGRGRSWGGSGFRFPTTPRVTGTGIGKRGQGATSA